MKKNVFTSKCNFIASTVTVGGKATVTIKSTMIVFFVKSSVKFNSTPNFHLLCYKTQKPNWNSLSNYNFEVL